MGDNIELHSKADPKSQKEAELMWEQFGQGLKYTTVAIIVTLAALALFLI
jgi:hypothetical protein